MASMNPANLKTALPPVVLLDRHSLEQLLSLEVCIRAVELAFAAHAQSRSIAPQLMHLDTPHGEFHIKVGGLLGEDGRRSYVACKNNGGFFGNRARYGLANIIGLIDLRDADNGMPLALMESGYITQLRTAAATAIAAKYLAQPTADTVTICGAGAQAPMQLRALCSVLPIRRVLVWSRKDASSLAARLASDLQREVHATQDLGAATLQSQVIVTCTPAEHWFLGRAQVAPGTFIAAVGADSPGKQELEPALTASAAVVCDITAQCARVGELHHAIDAGLMTATQVRGELGDLIVGHAQGRRSADEITIFDSTGTALQDAAAAAAAYERSLVGFNPKRFAFWG